MTQKTGILEDLVFNEQNVAVKVLLETPFSKEIRICFNEGQVMREHQTDFPITVQIVKGEIEFGVDGVKHCLKEGDLIALDPKVPHDLKANRQSVVRLTLSKADNIERVMKVVQG